MWAARWDPFCAGGRLFPVAEGTSKKDGTTYNYYKAGVNGESYDIYTNDELNKGDIVSFEPTNDSIYGTGKVTPITGTVKGKIFVGYMDKYNEKDQIITVFAGVQGVDKDDKDTNDPKKIDSYKDVESGSVTTFTTAEDQKNVILILKKSSDEVDAKPVVSAIITEISGKKDIINK